MKTGFLFLLFIIFSGLYPTHLHAKGSKEVTYQNGFIQLINGYQSNGLLSLKKSHGEDIVLFRQYKDSPKTYQYAISKLRAFQIGTTVHLVRYIQTPDGKVALAILTPVIPGNSTIFSASYYQQITLGKNNSMLKRMKTPYLLHRGEYIALSGADYKQKLADLWADEQAYLEKLNSYDKIGMEELQQILTD